MKNFSQNLKLLRKEKGLSQDKLAKLVGVSSRTIQYYEKGEATPKVGTARKIADILGVDFYELTGLEPVLQKAIHQTNINNGHQVVGNVVGDINEIIDDTPILTSKEKELIEAYNKLSPKKQEYYYLKIKADALEEEIRKED